MTDNVTDLNHFRLLKNTDEDEDDLLWRQDVLSRLDEIKERIASGETISLVIAELGDEANDLKLHTLGLAGFDQFTVAGLLENLKLEVLGSLYDE